MPYEWSLRIKCNQRCARVLDSAGELTDKIAISLSDSVGWRHSLNSNPEDTKALSTKNFREFASRIVLAGRFVATSLPARTILLANSDH